MVIIMKNDFKLSRHHHGFTLIEILIALSLGVFLLTGSIQMLSSTKEAYKINEQINRLQENGRFAIDLFVNQLRKKGYDDASTVFEPAVNGLTGVDFGIADTITIWYEGMNDRDCAGVLAAPGAQVNNVFQVNNGFLECNNQQVVEGVDAMQIIYGVDTDCAVVCDQTANIYVDATNVPDWSQVVSVRIYLLMRTLEALPDVKSYYYRGNYFSPVDGFKRKEFVTTIAFRN